MANKATVIDIDTKFLENIKKSEQALINAADAADKMTQMFVRATQGSGNMAEMFQNIQAGLDKVGAKADFSTGVLKVNTALRDTTDMVNTLTHNLDEAKSKYTSMISSMNPSGGKIGGRTGITLLKEEDLNNIGKLEKKVKEIDSFLSDGRRKTPSTETILTLTQFKEFYKAHIKELETTDEKRLEKKIKALRDEFKEMQRQIKAFEKEQKAAQKAVDDAEEERYKNELIRLHRRQKGQEEAAKKNADAEIEMQKRIEKQVSDRQEREKARQEKEKTVENARIANAKAKASIDAYVSNRDEPAATADDYAKMFDKIEAKAKKAAETIRKEYRNLNLEALASDPQKAIQFANKARTGDRLNVAKGILTQARNKATDEKDIDKINKALQLVEDKLNKINGKELNIRVKENIKIAKTSADISELERTIESLNSDKSHFNVDTTAGQKKIAEITAAVDQARAKIEALSHTSNDIEQLSDKDARTEYSKLEADARADTSERLLALQDRINTSTAKGYELYMKTGAQLRENEALMTKAALKSKDAKVSFDANAGALGIGNVESLVKMTSDAQTLRNAFEALRRAKRDINPNTEEGRRQIQQLNEALALTENRIKECANQQSRFMQAFNSIKGSGAGISSTFSKIFATGAIMGFANKVVRLHGEFEKLRKSLAVLVQSSEKANLIWGKITRLAVQSPFTVSDLATATRQMAAYRIEQDLIYEKTKMLADISAGLGVEMSRLILAYGQVKAANFLRGTELRQFSEAGIDMLGQLATYFTQLEGRLVTAADVFERISKRQVMFEDVDAVLERVTSRGGAYYKMQEEMASTVAGRISNLKDEFMLSMDNIGKSQNETILKVIRMLKWLAQNLDVVVEKLGFLLQVWLAWKSTVIVNTLVTKGYAIAMSLVTLATHKATIEMNRLTAATRAFNVASKGNALLAIASLAVGLVGAFSVIPKAIDSASDSIKESELNEEMDKMGDLAKEVAEAYAADKREIEELSDKILDLTKSINALNKEDAMSVKESDKVAAMMRERSILLSSLAGKTAEYSAELSAVLHDEEAMGRIIKRNNDELAAKNVIGDRIKKDINLSKALGGLEEAYYRRTTQTSYSRLESDTDYDPKVIRERYDPYHVFPDGVFEDREKVTENMRKYIKDIGYYIEEAKSIPLELMNENGVDVYSLRITENLKLWKRMAETNTDIYKYLGWDAENYLGNLGSLDAAEDVDLKLMRIAETHRKDLLQALYNAYGHASSVLEGYSPELLLEDKDVTGLVNILTETVKGAFDTSGLESSSKETREQTQRDIQEFLVSIFSAYEITDEAKYQLQQLLGEALGFTWFDFHTPLKSWHENFNKYTEEIRSSFEDKNMEIPFPLKEIISGDKTREDTKKALEEDLKLQKEIIATYEDNIKNEVSELASVAEVQAMRLNAAIENLMKKGYGEHAARRLLNIFPAFIPKFAPGISDEQYIGGSYTTKEYEEAVATRDAEEYALKFLGLDKDKDKNKKIASEAIKSINDVHKAFKELQKDFNDETSNVGAWEKYGKALEEALKPFGMSVDKFKSMFDLTTEDGMIAAFEWLKKQKGVAEELYEIERAIGDVKWEVKIENQNEAAEQLNREIEALFTGYELSIELEDLNIPKSLAQKFFDVDVTSLEELRSKLFEKKGEFVGKDQEEEYQKFLDKLDEMETKEQQNRLKKYLDFAKNNISERGKILLEEYEQMRDISKAFVLTDTMALNEGVISKEQRDELRKTGETIESLLKMSDEDIMSKYTISQDQIDSLRELNSALKEQQTLAEGRAREETSNKLTKLDFDVFKGSDVFETLYGDMENASETALNILITKLEEHSDQWQDMPLDEVKEYVDLLYQAKDALALSKMPKETISTAWKEIRESEFTSADDASKKMLEAELAVESLTEQLSIVENIERLKAQGKDNDVIITELNIQNSELLDKSSTSIKDSIGSQKQIISDAKQYLNTLRLIEKAYEKQRENINKVKSLVDRVFEGWESINSIFGDDTMSSAILGLTKGISDSAFGMSEMVSNAKQGIEALKMAKTGADAFGAAMNASAGIIGIIVTAVQAVATILKFAFEQHDKNLQKQIDAEQEKVESLQKAYEELERQIEKAYTSSDLGRLTAEATRNIEEQIAARKEMIALEEDKKKSDEDAMDRHAEEIDELERRAEELREQVFSTLTDGILDDVLGATRTFVDAWHDAYEESGDGMKGLEETFTDMLRNMLRQQASMQLISPFIKKYKKWLSDYVGDEEDPNLTAEEAREWAAKVKETFPEVNALLENFFDGTQDLLESNGELSDLEKGIQGMTEDQAEVLAAYWNSCRFTLTNIDMTLSNVADKVLGQAVTGDAMLLELKEQTRILKDIWTSLDSVIGVGGNTIHAGSYIKTNM